MKKKPPDNPHLALPTPQSDGLRCPKCGCAHLPVLYTRAQGNRIKRVRECRNCSKRITTYERTLAQGKP